MPKQDVQPSILEPGAYSDACEVLKTLFLFLGNHDHSIEINRRKFTNEVTTKVF